MPKLISQAVSESDITNYLKAGDDFPLEMRVLRACVNAGFGATHGGTYEDPVTGKDRQFDIRATLSNGNSTAKLAIECKNLKPSFPLLVSRVPRISAETSHTVIKSQYDPVLHPDNWVKMLHFFEGDSPFGLMTHIGKATIQVGKNEKGDWIANDAEVYEKWAQAVSSSVELVRLSARDNHLMNLPTALTVVLPILVVADGTLFAADYNSDGSLLSVHQEEECYLYLNKKIPLPEYKTVYRISHLGVFTETKFSGYLNRLSVNERYWDLLFPTSAR
jgi:hypothetical protein